MIDCGRKTRGQASEWYEELVLRPTWGRLFLQTVDWCGGEARWMSRTSSMCAGLVCPSVGFVVVLVAVDVAALRVLPMLDAGLLARADVAIRSRPCFGPIDTGLTPFQT